MKAYKAAVQQKEKEKLSWGEKITQLCILKNV